MLSKIILTILKIGLSILSLWLLFAFSDYNFNWVAETTSMTRNTALIIFFPVATLVVHLVNTYQLQYSHEFKTASMHPIQVTGMMIIDVVIFFAVYAAMSALIYLVFSFIFYDTTWFTSVEWYLRALYLMFIGALMIVGTLNARKEVLAAIHSDDNMDELSEQLKSILSVIKKQDFSNKDGKIDDVDIMSALEKSGLDTENVTIRTISTKKDDGNADDSTDEDREIEEILKSLTDAGIDIGENITVLDADKVDTEAKPKSDKDE